MLRPLVRCMLLTAIIMCAGATAMAQSKRQDNPKVLPANSYPYGSSYSVWTARWWQWAYGLPVAGHPLFDETGVDCAAGQSGPVWFLGGVFNVSGTATRTLCEVPAGKALFFPVINVEWDNVCPPDNLTEEELRARADMVADNADMLACEIDGLSVRNLQSYRFQSPTFEVTFPAGSIFDLFCGTPAGTYSPFVGDGYYVMVAPLSVGEHSIHFHGRYPDFGFELDITYYFNVVPESQLGSVANAAGRSPAGLRSDLEELKPWIHAGTVGNTWGSVKTRYR